MTSGAPFFVKISYCALYLINLCLYQVPCTVDEDPNAAPKCDPADCVIPDCFCSADGTKVPGNIEVGQVPQMIMLSFNGAMNVDNIPIYQEVFADGKY